MKPGYSEKFLRKRKFLLVLPILVTPFITLAFYALGGGKGSEDLSTATDQLQGLNIRLPDATQNGEDMLDKMSFYQQAERDSVRIHDQEKSDPYFRSLDSGRSIVRVDSAGDIEKWTTELSNKYSQPVPGPYSGLNTSPASARSQADASEQQIMAKLSALDKAINQPPQKSRSDTEPYMSRALSGQGSPSDVDRLESMMQVVNSKQGQDEEMQQLNGTLERILDIQHPERVSEKIRQASAERKTQVFPMDRMSKDKMVSLIQSSGNDWNRRDTVRRVKSIPGGFYPLDDNTDQAIITQNSVEAVIDETQTVVSGATVKLRLVDDIYVNGTRIPRNTSVFGTAFLNDERLKINIHSIKYGKSLFPVSLSVYDIDGMEGVFVPGAISREVVKESTGQALQGVGLTSLSPSVSAQAASAGIQAAKALLTRKVKLVRVTVKSGYQVLLKDESL